MRLAATPPKRCSAAEAEQQRQRRLVRDHQAEERAKAQLRERMERRRAAEELMMPPPRRRVTRERAAREARRASAAVEARRPASAREASEAVDLPMGAEHDEPGALDASEDTAAAADSSPTADEGSGVAGDSMRVTEDESPAACAAKPGAVEEDAGGGAHAATHAHPLVPHGTHSLPNEVWAKWHARFGDGRGKTERLTGQYVHSLDDVGRIERVPSIRRLTGRHRLSESKCHHAFTSNLRAYSPRRSAANHGRDWTGAALWPADQAPLDGKMPWATGRAREGARGWTSARITSNRRSCSRSEHVVQV